MAFNILIVDDSETVRAVIEKTLSMSGLALGELFLAAHGKEALEVLDREWIDLVFTDINMPVMNGMELIAAMRKNALLDKTPVVVISTEGSKTRIDDLLEQGIRAYIRKPFTPEKLRDVVEELLGSQDDATND